MRTRHGYAQKRVAIIIASEQGHPFAEARAAGLRSTVDRPPACYRTPSAATLRDVRDTLDAYESLRPAGGFASVQEQAHAQVAAIGVRDRTGDYLDGAVVAYERARKR